MGSWEYEVDSGRLPGFCLVQCPMKCAEQPAQAYKRHERSREAIEMAYESILNQDMKKRQKYGFKPPKLGRKTDAQAGPEACSHTLSPCTKT